MDPTRSRQNVAASCTCRLGRIRERSSQTERRQTEYCEFCDSLANSPRRFGQMCQEGTQTTDFTVVHISHLSIHILRRFSASFRIRKCVWVYAYAAAEEGGEQLMYCRYVVISNLMPFTFQQNITKSITDVFIYIYTYIYIYMYICIYIYIYILGG